MLKTRNSIYLLLATLCTAGYAWLLYCMQNNAANLDNGVNVCLFKYLTGVPCPSCGSTHAVVHILQGDLGGAVLWNPIGFLLIAALIVLPFWLGYDVLSRKQTLLDFYRLSEKLLQTKRIAVPAIALVLLNWIWIIYKHL